MDAVASNLLEYFQKNTLWQFFSRDWDRKENLDGVFGALDLLVKGEPVPRETPMDKVFYADAVVLLPELLAKVPGFAELGVVARLEALATSKAELWDIVLTHSKNAELYAELY